VSVKSNGWCGYVANIFGVLLNDLVLNLTLRQGMKIGTKVLERLITFCNIRKFFWLAFMFASTVALALFECDIIENERKSLDGKILAIRSSVASQR
jgi:hypothetical protein